MYLSLKVAAVGQEVNSQDLVVVHHGSEDHVVDVDGLGGSEWTEWWTGQVGGQEGDGCDGLLRRGLVSNDQLKLRLEIKEL